MRIHSSSKPRTLKYFFGKIFNSRAFVRDCKSRDDKNNKSLHCLSFILREIRSHDSWKSNSQVMWVPETAERYTLGPDTNYHDFNHWDSSSRVSCTFSSQCECSPRITMTEIFFLERLSKVTQSAVDMSGFTNESITLFERLWTSSPKSHHEIKKIMVNVLKLRTS
jgi:hypothetical protein